MEGGRDGGGDKLSKLFKRQHIKGKHRNRKRVNQAGDFNDKVKRYKSVRNSGDPKGSRVYGTHPNQKKVVVENVTYKETGVERRGETGVSHFMVTGEKSSKIFTPQHLDGKVTKTEDGKYKDNNYQSFSLCTSSESAGINNELKSDTCSSISQLARKFAGLEEHVSKPARLIRVTNEPYEWTRIGTKTTPETQPKRKSLPRMKFHSPTSRNIYERHRRVAIENVRGTQPTNQSAQYTMVDIDTIERTRIKSAPNRWREI